FKNTYALEDKEIEFIVSNKALANYVENVISELRAWYLAENPKGEAKEYYDDRRNITHLAVNWLVNKLLKFVYEAKQTVKDLKITPENFAEFIKLIYQDRINSKNAQEVLAVMFHTGQDPSQIIEEKDLWQLGTTEDIEAFAEKVINENPKQVEQYKGGKIEVMKFLIGQVMKETRGKANPQIVNQVLIHKLK
ncbi:MAG: Asp-tRNA(Asn)/Glu-tRNA(Gln) amidotransferase subunit GatB, partial [bacterium]|nr:Asp-tRNA(Asn)/Glu-tRNA(Gln) amidotransferase subunit GatB [bacterium]